MGRTIALGCALALAGGFLVACGSGAAPFDASSGESAPMTAESMPAGSMPVQDPSVDRMGEQVITTAQVSIEVTDVASALDAIEEATKASEGFIQSRSVNNVDGDSMANVTVRVPAAALDDFLDQLTELGDVTNQTVDAQDVTLEVIDLEARISTLEDSIARLRDLQQQATSVADLVAVESELATRQAELESLTARRDYLANQVDLSTVYVMLDQRDVGPELSPDFLGGLQRGWDALLTLGAGLITAAGFLLPLAVVVAIVLAIVFGLIRTIRTRRRSRHKDPT